jgi:hypothetical protein
MSEQKITSEIIPEIKFESVTDVLADLKEYIIYFNNNNFIRFSSISDMQVHVKRILTDGGVLDYNYLFKNRIVLETRNADGNEEEITCIFKDLNETVETYKVWLEEMGLIDYEHW